MNAPPADLGALNGATIVFDLDGTLIDTAPDLVVALNKTLADGGLAPFSIDSMRALVGQGARALLQRAGAVHDIHFSNEKLDALTDVFVAHYSAAIADQSRPFPGCLAALDVLQAAGARLCVCTNKRTGLSQALLDALGVSGRFDAIVGADAVSARKPSSIHYIETVRRAGGALSRSVMVGDTSADIGAARGAGRPVILAAFGYLDQPIAALKADALIDSYDALPGIAAQLLRDFSA